MRSGPNGDLANTWSGCVGATTRSVISARKHRGGWVESNGPKKQVNKVSAESEGMVKTTEVNSKKDQRRGKVRFNGMTENVQKCRA